MVLNKLISCLYEISIAVVFEVNVFMIKIIKMAAINDVTGDLIKSKALSKQGQDNWVSLRTNSSRRRGRSAEFF